MNRQPPVPFYQRQVPFDQQVQVANDTYRGWNLRGRPTESADPEYRKLIAKDPQIPSNDICSPARTNHYRGQMHRQALGQDATQILIVPVYNPTVLPHHVGADVLIGLEDAHHRPLPLRYRLRNQHGRIVQVTGHPLKTSDYSEQASVDANVAFAVYANMAFSPHTKFLDSLKCYDDAPKIHPKQLNPRPRL
jgi:hypothetical protein